MASYLIHHRSYVSQEIRADYYRNDPYVWHSPYLWSFCHINQRPRVEPGMTILWLSKADGTFVCDLVFVVAYFLPLPEARERFAPHDRDLARHHFAFGVKNHRNYARSPYARTYVADMDRSYIPNPAVPLESAVDLLRLRERSTPKPLSVAWARPAAPLRIEAIDELEAIVRSASKEQVRGPLSANWSSPGQSTN